ncbi:MAG: hypothetical protein H7A32_00565 [Deltaproteobacteria bacterium]|nr:hypothetical protein [Deltaproteobacteria bacterium]
MKRFGLIFGVLMIGLGVISCSDDNEETPTDKISLDSTLNWYGNNRETLEKYLNNHALGGTNYNTSDYVVFDFDNSTIYNDIENCFVAYMALNGHVKRPAGNDWKLITPDASPELETALDTNCAGDGEFLPTNADCVDTIFSAYYEGAVSSEPDAADAFTIGSNKLYRPDYAFGGQIIAGNTPVDAATYSAETADWCLGLGLDEEVTVGNANYKLAIRFYDEILDVMKALEKANIPFVISTASPEYLVVEAAKLLPVQPDAVIGVRLKVEDGVYTGKTVAIGEYGEGEIMNYQLGKVISLLEFYEGLNTSGLSDKQIIDATNISAGFCDSDTDAQFIKSAKHVAFCLNRNKSGIMCPMYHWQANGDPDRPDKDFLINPIFIKEHAKSKKEDSYSCSIEDLPAGMGIDSIAAEIEDTVYWE